VWNGFSLQFVGIRYSDVFSDRKTIKGTLHEDLHAFLGAKVTGWRIPAWGIPRLISLPCLPGESPAGRVSAW
jgi:hypothetical protein